jgi:hypothetical protein
MGMALGALLGAELGLLLGSYSGYVEHGNGPKRCTWTDAGPALGGTGRSTRRAARSS